MDRIAVDSEGNGVWLVGDPALVGSGATFTGRSRSREEPDAGGHDP